MELRKISKEELDEVLKLHKAWLYGKEGGRRADLSYTDLNNADLRCSDLSHADLSCTDLSRSDLSYADLNNADLSHANLSWANLSWANLSRSNLSGTDLSHANLRCANLSRSNLSGVNLSRSNLSGVNLSGANLRWANLRCANLSGVNLSGADLNNVKYDEKTLFFTLQCPEEGSFIGYKKSANKIVKLRIEEDSKRSSATSRKCRASKVTVLSITSLDGKENFKEVSNTSRYKFTYKVGETYTIDNFDDNRWNECSTGIHFFITRNEAVNY